MDDRKLVEQLLQNDPLAQKAFDEAFRPMLKRAATQLLGYGDPDVDDVVQDSLLNALNHLADFEFRSSLSHWVYRIGMYRAFERFRQRKKMVSHLSEDLETLARGAAVDRTRREEEAQEKAKMLKLLADAREKMGDPCREVLELRDVKELPYAGIAERLKVPIGTVMSRLARCKETLKELVLRAARAQEKDHD